MLKNILPLLLLLLAAAPGQASRQLQQNPDWTIHSSFDNRPRRIVDTPARTFFFVHQRPFQKNGYYVNLTYTYLYDFPAGAVFFIDKNDPDARLRDLQQAATLSGTDMRLFEVDPLSGIMAIAYTDGGVDLVTPDFQVHYFDQIKRRNFPGAAVINNIVFDETDRVLRALCGSGWIEISLDSYQLTRNISWPAAVTDLVALADRHAAVIDGAICIAPAGADIRRQDAFAPIENTAFPSSYGVPVRLLPLSPTHLGVVTLSGSISYATYAEATDKWTWKSLKKESSLLQADNVSVANRMEHTVLRTASGWMIGRAAATHILDKPVDDQPAPVFSTITPPTGTGLYYGSYDLSAFWFYKDRGLFQKRTLADDRATWSDPELPIRPDAPLFSSETVFAYSPTLGLVGTNAQGGYYSSIQSTRLPALTCTYKDGKWNNRAGAYHTPAYAAENETFASKYASSVNIWPVADPKAMIVDPLYPDWVHMGGVWTGFASFNVADPTVYPLLSIPPTNTFSQFPCLKIDAATWGTYSASYPVGFDADNNLWMFKANTWNKDSSRQNLFTFMYMTPESRAAFIESGDPAQAEWHVIDAEAGDASFYQDALLLRHPANAGKFLVSVQGMGRPVHIFDHKGTLDDTSDDVLTRVDNIVTPSGGSFNFDFVNSFLEDPVTGEVYVFGRFDSYILDLPNHPAQPDGSVYGRSFTIRDSNGAESQVMSPLTAASGCFDEYGRLWVATLTGGVLGINPRTGELLKHYNTANSPLPSNEVRSVGWNPDTKSLFISTRLGIAEVRVDGDPSQPAQADPFTEPYLYPASVGHDFAGTVAVRNVPAGVTLVVTDPDGRIVADLPAPQGGVTHWNLLTRDGRRAAPGLYLITDRAQQSPFRPLPLPLP